LGELHRQGTTILHLQQVKPADEPRDELLDAVRQMAAGDFEVFGEIGRGPDSTVVYLANDIAASRLVALKLAPGRGQPDEYVLDVVKELDSTLPSFENFCSQCGAPLRQWGRFCTRCGADQYSTADQRWTADELRDAVQSLAEGRFEILGEMRTQGGGRIYFARDVASGKVEALRLQKKSEDEFSLGFTGVLKPVVASVVGTDRPSLAYAEPPSSIESADVETPMTARPQTRPATESAPQPPTPAPLAQQPPPLGGEAPARPIRPRPPAIEPDQWAPLKEFVQHPVVMGFLLAAVILFLVIILSLVI
jgi:hypothetical protein